MTPQDVALLIVNGSGLRYGDQRPCTCCPSANGHGFGSDFLHFANLCRGIAINEAAIIVVSDKTNLLALSLRSDRQTTLSGHRAYLRLSIVAQRETGMRQLVLVQHVKHIGLILIKING